MLRLAAVTCWAAALLCVWFLPGAHYIAKAGDRAKARVELASGIIIATVLTAAGMILW